MTAGIRHPVGGWRLWWNPETRRYPWMLAGGLAWALAFPTPGIAGLAWVVPGLLLFGAVGLPRGAAFRCGFVAGLVHFLVSLRWLLNIPFPAGAAAGWLALSAYLACFPGLWVMLCAGLLPGPASGDSGTSSAPAGSGPSRRGGPPETLTPLGGRWSPGGGPGSGLGIPDGPWRRSLEAHAARPWLRRVVVPLAAAAAWVAWEMVQARLLSGFAWNFLGVSQWRQVPLIQLAAHGGVYAVSFLMCWASVALVGGCLMVTLRPENRWLWLAEARLPLFAVLVALGTGFYQIIQERRFLAVHPPERLRIALIQPAIPQTLLWDPAESGRSFATAAALSDQALATRPELLVWPEGSFGLTATNYAAMIARLSRTGAEWVFSEVDRDETGPRPIDYNAAFQIGPTGRIQGTYRKRRLVLFGEYVPLARWLPFLKWFTPIGEGFGFGDRPVALSLAGGRAQAAPIICFEDTFPHGVRDHVTPAVDFLLELTNDAWFGESGAQWQHAANAAFRAVENGVPVVRCTNNGVTGWFDHYGTLQDQLGAGGAAVYRQGFLLAEIPLRRPGRIQTVYQRRGDLFGWLCVGYTAVTLGRTLRPRRPVSSESSDRPSPA